MIKYLIYIITLMSTVNLINGQQSNIEIQKFHDFALKIEGLDHSKREDYKFELFGRKHEDTNPLGYIIKSDSLQYIKTLYSRNNDLLIIERDTFSIILNESQLDKLYEICVNNFRIGPNLTKFPIPPPPPPFDGITAQLEFELSFRGEKYIKIIRIADLEITSDKEFGKLLDWLLKHFE